MIMNLRTCAAAMSARGLPRALWMAKGVAASAVVVGALGAAGCGGGGSGEAVATQSQADLTSDLLSDIGDTSAVVAALSTLPDGAGAGAVIAAAIGLVNVSKDAYVLTTDGNSNANAALEAQINLLQGEIQQLGSQINQVDALELADAQALDLDIANGARVNLATVAQFLGDNLAALRAGTLDQGSIDVLSQDVLWVENTITSQIEPAIENPVPGAYPAGDAYWFQTYEIALNVRLALAVAGFPINYDWALARYQNMHSEATIPWGDDNVLFPWGYPGTDTGWATMVDTWGTVMWAMFEPYRALRGAADFDHDGVPDLVMHDPATGTVLATRMVPTQSLVPVGRTVAFEKGFRTGAGAAGGWVRNFGTVDPLVWNLVSVADIDGDGNPDFLFESTQPGGMLPNDQQIYGSGRIWFTNGTSVTRDVTMPAWPGGMRCIGPFGTAGAQGYIEWQYVTPHEDANHNALYPAWASSSLMFKNMPIPLQVPLTAEDFANGGNLLAAANPLISVDVHGIPSLDSHWHLRGCADLNGDGIVDPVWYHGADTDGTLQAWLSSASPPGDVVDRSIQPATIGEVGTAGEDIRAVADFTQDGHPDLLWQDDSTGTLFVRALDGVADAGEFRLVTVVPQLVLPTPIRVF
jgi:hypothetical protein